jgi:hypothetical protein
MRSALSARLHPNSASSWNRMRSGATRRPIAIFRMASETADMRGGDFDQAVGKNARALTCWGGDVGTAQYCTAVDLLKRRVARARVSHSAAVQQWQSAAHGGSRCRPCLQESYLGCTESSQSAPPT